MIKHCLIVLKKTAFNSLDQGKGHIVWGYSDPKYPKYINVTAKSLRNCGCPNAAGMDYPLLYTEYDILLTTI